MKTYYDRMRMRRDHTERDWSSYERSIVQGGLQQGHIQSGNEDEGETKMRGNIPGWDQIGVSGSCVRMGSDTGSPYTPSLVTTMGHNSDI